jgi:hypothetical protein
MHPPAQRNVDGFFGIATAALVNFNINGSARPLCSGVFGPARVTRQRPGIAQRVKVGMKIVLHIGAHRTGTTSFQAYMRRHWAVLAAQGIGFWGPVRTRKGLFTGIQPTPGLGVDAARRARGRILLQLDKAAKQGAHTLVISDENMMGSSRLNLRSQSLYPDVGERFARYAAAFDNRIDTVALSVRSLDHFWLSTAAYGVHRGHDVPGPAQLDRIATGRRSWRDVIADVSCAAPQAAIKVLPFERFAGRSDRFLGASAGVAAPVDTDPDWLNRSPDTHALRHCLHERGSDAELVPAFNARWTLFEAEHRACLREAYADDMQWLVAGAHGLATLTEDMDRKGAGHTLPGGSEHRGHPNDTKERRLAQPG